MRRAILLEYKKFFEKETGEMTAIHGLDNEKQVFFYEHEFYVLSNFSSFAIHWRGELWPTVEHAYHAEKFEDEDIKEKVRNARSAHAALKIAEINKDKYRKDWHDNRLGVMKELLRAKVCQHEYVKRKLLETGERELVEDSWRDSFWGWGPDKDGQIRG